MSFIQEIIQEKDAFWCRQGPGHDIVISSRVRIGRNCSYFPFPSRMDEGEMEFFQSLADKVVAEFNERANAVFFKIASLDLHQKRLLRERNLITSEMETSPFSQVILDRDRDFAILINEADHFRIQVIRPGLQLFECYKLADSIDDSLNRVVRYAFNRKSGYLTSNPAFCGTGLKVSVIMHLPALVFQKKLNTYINDIRDRGFIMTGTLGNAGRIIGGLYHVSNKNIPGLKEEEIIARADDIINMLMRYEDEARDSFMKDSGKDLEDAVWRSFGILKYAKRLNYVETVEHLSRLRLGVVMSLLKGMDLYEVNDLMVKIQWSHLQEYFGIRFNSIVSSDEFRALFIKKELKQGEV